MTLKRRNSFNPYDSPVSQSSPKTLPSENKSNESITNNIDDLPKLEPKEPSTEQPEYEGNPLWDYFMAELQVSEYDPSYEIKLERISNFFLVPKQVEKLMFFGGCICLNTLLYGFTILPLRAGIALFKLIAKPFTRKKLNSTQNGDLLKCCLIFSACCLLRNIDASIIYHSIRVQSSVKLYVIFNMLEIFDRLLCSFGQDVLDSFFAEVTLGKSHRFYKLKPLSHFLVCVVYVFLHSLVLFYQMICLNAAINSHNNSLLSLLMSNQFVEIKGSVFKRFERENLFQVSCSDMVERFQLSVYLVIITVRNSIELWGSWVTLSPSFSDFSINSLMKLIPTNFDSVWNLVVSPVMIVLICETLVDWLKHSFITKFNHVRPAVYDRYIDILCKDLITAMPNRIDQRGKPHILMDQSPVVARRIGFSVLPITCLIIRIAIQIFNSSGLIDFSFFSLFQSIRNFNFNSITIDQLISKHLEIIPIFIVGLLIYLLLLSIKLILGIQLLRFGLKRYHTMMERERIDQELAVRDKQLGEKDYIELKNHLNQYPEDTYKATNINLNNIERYTLFRSRIP